VVVSAEVDLLPDLLGRLKLRAMRERLDVLLEKAARRELSLREALALLYEAEMQRRDERRIQMGTGIAKFPFIRTLDGFDFKAQPSVDAKQIRDLAAYRWVANGDAIAPRAAWCRQNALGRGPGTRGNPAWFTRCCLVPRSG
jgi:DNA replication protein DnaC